MGLTLKQKFANQIFLYTNFSDIISAAEELSAKYTAKHTNYAFGSSGKLQYGTVLKNHIETALGKIDLAQVQGSSNNDKVAFLARMISGTVNDNLLVKPPVPYSKNLNEMYTTSNLALSTPGLGQLYAYGYHKTHSEGIVVPKYNSASPNVRAEFKTALENKLSPKLTYTNDNKAGHSNR